MYLKPYDGGTEVIKILTMFNQSIVFEQPVNELLRVCIRIEHLLSTAEESFRSPSEHGTRACIHVISNLLALTDRHDLRGKFTKEFIRQQSNLQRFLNEAGVDQNKLQMALDELEAAIELLQGQNGKFANNLRENEFLSSVRQHIAMPGGGLSFDVPAFYFWLQQPFKERREQLTAWLEEFDDMIQVTQFMLRLVRQSGQAVHHTAIEGFFQASLDPQMPCQLIRVAVPNTIAVFPELSVGRHGVSIRFYYPSVAGRATPYEKDVPFRLICCVM